MRVVVLGLNHAIPSFRSRWKRLAEYYHDTNILVIPPHSWLYPWYGTEKPVRFIVEAEETSNYHVMPIDLYPHNSGRAIYRSLALKLRKMQPDIIWITMGPQSFMMQQAILYRNLYAPQAKLICCVSSTIPTPLDRFDKRWRYRFALRNLAAFSTETQAMVDLLRSEGVTQPILHKLMIGADEQLWHPGEEADLRKKLGLGDFVVGFVGRHEEAKGLPEIVAALEGLGGDWSFLSIGDGPLKEETELRLKAARGEKGGVCILGYVPREETPPYFRCMDVLVLFSRQIEMLGLVIVEANLSRVVAVVSDLPGPAEAVGDTGFVVPVGNVSALRERLSYLRDNIGLRKQMGQDAHRRALQMFSTTSIARDTYAFFLELLAQR